MINGVSSNVMNITVETAVIKCGHYEGGKQKRTLVRYLYIIYRPSRFREFERCGVSDLYAATSRCYGFEDSLGSSDVRQ